MREILTQLDMPTMVLSVVALYVALTLVLVYTAVYRRTYPGFTAMTLALILWTGGIFLTYYRVVGETTSLFCGNLLMTLMGVMLFHGLARYGEMPDAMRRSSVNIALCCLEIAVHGYYLFINYDTCRRVVAFSAYFAIVYGRIAFEPYLVRRWRTYATQGVLSAIYGMTVVAFLARAFQATQSTDCAPGGPDSLAKLLLLIAILCSPLIAFCILAMTSSRVEAELLGAREALRKLAQTDSLTGLPNRRHFLKMTDAAMAEAQTAGRRLCLVMLDLDYFKEINDTHGHQAGDMVLCAVARCLQATLPDTDCIGRLGGEEFGILMPACDMAGACAAAERLRRAIERLAPGGHTITACMGVAAGAEGVDALLAEADTCLYVAKRDGRNRVVCQGYAAVNGAGSYKESTPS
jgi:diguanylate cyclase (GGDEF)-like protein